MAYSDLDAITAHMTALHVLIFRLVDEGRLDADAYVDSLKVVARNYADSGDAGVAYELRRRQQQHRG